MERKKNPCVLFTLKKMREKIALLSSGLSKWENTPMCGIQA
jgi:hypothetical protein